MPSLGPAEILVILVVALLVFGPDKMPEIGRQIVRGVREFRKVQQHLTSELHDVVSELDVTAPARPDTAPGAPATGGDPVPTLPPIATPSPTGSSTGPTTGGGPPRSIPADAPGSAGEAPPSPPAEPA